MSISIVRTNVNATRSSNGISFAAAPIWRLRPVAAACAAFVTCLTFPLSASAQSDERVLPEITVSESGPAAWVPAAAPGGQVARGARLGLLGNVDVMDAPFNMTSYTAQTIADQQASTLAAVLENDPSIRFTASTGHAYENYTIRGFGVTSTELSLNGLYGMAPDAHVPTEILERVEVLKGPGALLSGMTPGGAIGGVVNLVTKRPENGPLTRLTGSLVSASRLGIHADVSRRFGEEQRLGVRFNGAISSGDAEVDDQSKKHRFGSLALDYQGDDWLVQLDAYSLRDDMRNGSPVMVGFSTLKRVIAAPDPSTNLFRGIHAEQESDAVTVRAEVRLNRDWSVFGAVGKAQHSYLGFLNGTRVVLTAKGNGDAIGQTYHQAGYTDSETAEAGVRGKFSSGPVTHRVALSASTLTQESGRFTPVPTSASYTTNIYNPITPLLPKAPGRPTQESHNVISSVALADTLSFAQDKVQLTLGLRSQNVKQNTPAYDKTAITPAVGVVFKPWDESLSLYANYIEGLSAGSQVGPTFANAGHVFAPFKTKQSEVGVKWQQDHLTQTVSLFDIAKPSIITDAATNTQQLNGEQRNRGMEWNVFGELTPTVRVLGGAAYTQAKQEKTPAGKQNGFNVFGVPRWTANLGSEWDVPGTQGIKGITVSARMVYTGKQWVNSTNTMELPAWTRIDLGARHATRIDGKDVTIRASVDNVFDRHYWAGSFNDGFATVAGARTFRASVSVDL